MKRLSLGIMLSVLLLMASVHTGWTHYIELQDHLAYRQNESVQLIGWVRNVSIHPRELISVKASLKDETGRNIQTRSEYVMLDELRAGEISPFAISFDSGEEFSRYSIQLQSHKLEKAPVRHVEVVTSEGISESNQFRVKGAIRNTGNRVATNVKVVCVGLKGEDQHDTGVAGVGYTFPSVGSLKPGEQAEFELTIPQPPRQVKRYLLKVQAQYKNP